jgi:prevent-host-death family protein
MTTQVSIGQVKRDISELVNRVAYSGERIVLTSRGKPKAVIVSLDDYARLKEAEEKAQIKYREKWLEDSRSLANQIRESHGNNQIDIDAIIAMDQDERDQRYE